MIVRINGVELQNFGIIDTIDEQIEKVKIAWNPNSKLKTIATTMWMMSSVLVTKVSHAATNPSVWEQMEPVFAVFQDMAMVLGSLAIISGLIVLIFKRKLGWTFITTSALVIGGCFLVPAAVMLIAIIGGMLNDALTTAFNNVR